MPIPDAAFVVPTLPALVDRIAGDLSARIPGLDARVRRSQAHAIARVFAGLSYEELTTIRRLLRQVLWDTAEGEYLRRWAAIFGLAPIVAARAVGSVTFTGVAATAIPTGTALVRADGRRYTVNAPGGTIGGGGSVALPVTAVVVGADGNAVVAVVLSLATPIAGVDPTVLVGAGGLTGGRDEETDAALRLRLLARIRLKPQGGAAADYVVWTRDATGVSGTVDRVHVQGSALGAGTVRVLFTKIQIGTTPSTVIPSGADVAAVQAYVDPRRPVTAQVTVAAPVARLVNLSITLVPNTATVRAAVDASLDAMFARESVPSGTVRNSWIREAISSASGETHHALTSVAGDGTGLSDVVLAATEVATRGVVTYS